MIKLNFEEFVKLIESDQRIIILDRDKNEIFCRSKNGSKKIIRIPLRLTPSLAFLSGCIIGDGHLGKEKFRINIEMTSLDILNIINFNFRNTFLIDTSIKNVKQRPNKSQSWKIKFESKSIWLLFNKLFEIPAGKKSNIVKVPDIIKNSNDENIIRHFIFGLFLADGGHKKNDILFSTTSEKLAHDLKDIFDQLGIITCFNTINDHKLRRIFFEILIRERNVVKFKNLLPEIDIKFNQAGVA